VGGVSVGRSAIHGALGFVVPTVVVLVSYPVLLRQLGVAAFGVYMLALSLSGTVLALDLGFSAATLKFVAEDLAAGRRQAAAEVIATSLSVYGALGLIGGASIAVLAPQTAAVLKIAPVMAPGAIAAFRLAGLQFAFFLPGTVFLSIAKGIERFDRSALFLSFLSFGTYGGAMLAVVAGGGLVGAMATAVAANLALLLMAAADAVQLCRERGLELSHAQPRRLAIRRMFGFGWFMTVNSISGILLYQFQKYLVSAALGPAAVAVYQTASVAASKAHAAVNAATEVMFPFSIASRDRAMLRRVYLRMLGASALVALAAFIGLAALARPLLTLWMGARIAALAAPLVPIFALAYAFLALSPAPFHLLNGLGKPWFNTFFYAMNAGLNLVFVSVFSFRGITLAKLAWAFACANIVTSVSYQIAVELLIWRRESEDVPVMPGKHLSEASA